MDAARSEVSVSYTGTVPELADVPGVEGVRNSSDGQLRFTLIGPPGAALRTLAAADVTALGGLAALSASPAVRTLFGEPLALGDPGGFTVWRTGTVVAVLLGTWSILATTRITRGEEDAGRWNLLAAGRASLRSIVRLHVLVLSAVSVVVGVAIWAALVAAGTDATVIGAAGYRRCDLLI